MNVALDTSLSYIGVDRGIETLLQNGITPIIGVGDFDSIQNSSVLANLDIKTLPVRKDITDTHYAIIYAIQLGYDEMDIYGVTGGRMDHFMAILCLLEKYQETKITIIDAQNKIRLLLPGKHEVYQDEYTYFSLFSLQDSYIDLDSCQYPLQQYYLTREDSLCVSNQVVGNKAIVTTTNTIFIVKSKDIR